MATVPGALSAVATLAGTTGAKLAWVPRRAGDRGAVETGCLPNLLPGGRPVADAAARVDVGTAWGIDGLPEEVGRDADAIVAALVAGDLGGLVIGGVDPDDTADPAATRAALGRRPLRGRARAPRDRRDPGRRRGVPGGAGDRQGRHVRHLGGPARGPSTRSWPTRRACPTCVSWPASPRSSAGLWASGPAPRCARDGVARSLGRRAPGSRRVVSTTDGLDRRGPNGTFALATWKQLIDLGSMQDGQDGLPGHRPPPGRQAQPRGVRRARRDRHPHR